MTTRRFTVCSTLAWAAAMCVAMLLQEAGSGAQAPQDSPPHPQVAAALPADMAARCQAMMAGHETMMGGREAMMAGMKAADERIDRLVATMAEASGQAKLDAMTAVVTEIVAQQRSMRDEMMCRMHAAPAPSAAAAAVPVVATPAAAPVVPAVKAPVATPAAAPAAPPVAGNPVNGEKIYAAQKCSVCHRIGETGGKMGPDLSAVATRRSSAWMAEYLVAPKALDAKNKMAPVKVKGQDLKDLIAYLGTLKGKTWTTP